MAKAKVLIIDGRQKALDLLGNRIRADGHEIEITSDAAVGLEKFGNGNFDAVVAGLVRPGMDNDALVSSIHNISPKMLIIIFTGEV